MSTGTLGLLLPICVAAATLAVFIAIIVIKCYLNWKREHKKDYQELRLADGTVQHLVLSSQPIDFVPLLIQDRLEEEEELDEFDTCTSLTHCYISGASSEDISYEQTKNQTSSKVKVKSTVNQAILTENTVLQPRSQGISSSRKKRDSGNEVGLCWSSLLAFIMRQTISSSWHFKQFPHL